MDSFTFEEIQDELTMGYQSFSRDQICDGNIACPITEFDEKGCNLDNGDRDDEDTTSPGSNPEP